MKVSKADLTIGQLQRWEEKGYIIVLDADSEYADIHKPLEQPPNPDPIPTYA